MGGASAGPAPLPAPSMTRCKLLIAVPLRCSSEAGAGKSMRNSFKFYARRSLQAANKCPVRAGYAVQMRSPDAAVSSSTREVQSRRQVARHLRNVPPACQMCPATDCFCTMGTLLPIHQASICFSAVPSFPDLGTAAPQRRNCISCSPR